MSGWIAEECGKIVDDSGAFLGRANSDEDAKNLCADHNADCDAYEARIAELEEERDAAVEFAHATERAFCTATAELARVKAESLRVVVDGGPVTAFRLDGNDKFIQVEGDVYYRSGEQFICTNTRIYQGFDDDTIVQPVRLERWEDA